ncbi:MAG: EF-hand domain-containing protein [Magnetococcales bacterium]|nr:EF-hand domain-containing protein [Magnetococcales bacterium]
METFRNEIKAKTGGGMGMGMAPPPKPPSAEDMISQMDQDDDGLISTDEAEGLLAERFEKADTNQDGKVDQAELQADMEASRAEGHQPPPGGMGGESTSTAQSLIDMIDQDGNGEIGSDELQLLLDAMQSDQNSDSNASASDLASSATPFGLVQYMLAAQSRQSGNDTQNAALSLTA